MTNGVAAWRLARLLRQQQQLSQALLHRAAYSAWIKRGPGPSVSTPSSSRRVLGDDAQSSLADCSIERLFTDPRVQELLRRLTGCEAEKRVYASRIQPNTSRKHYVVMSEEQNEEAHHALQFVPVKEPRAHATTGEVISVDAEIADFDQCKYIFTDISFDTTDQERTVVVREVDGTLRTANVEEQYRMNRIFYERPARPVNPPAVFADPHLQDALDRNRHEFVLDWACYFFEPDDPAFISLSQNIYDRTLQQGKAALLHSTRHYGPFIFYHVINGNLPPLLNQAGSLSEAATLIRLQKRVLPDWKTTVSVADDDLTVVKGFLGERGTSRGKLENLVKLVEEAQQRPLDDAQIFMGAEVKDKKAGDAANMTWRMPSMKAGNRLDRDSTRDGQRASSASRDSRRSTMASDRGERRSSRDDASGGGSGMRQVGADEYADEERQGEKKPSRDAGRRPRRSSREGKDAKKPDDGRGGGGGGTGSGE